MLELNEQQLLFVSNQLSDAGLQYTPLYEELLDHVCCTIETKMADGQNFHQACDDVFNAFGKEGIKELQKQTIYSRNQKSHRMRNVSMLFFVFTLFMGPLIWFNAISAWNHSESIVQEQEFASHTKEQKQFKEPPSMRPLGPDYEMNSGFGKRMHPIFKVLKMHKGVDFRAPLGTPVYATSDGTVIKAKYNNKGYGNHIIIQHDEVYQTKYAQLHSIEVKEGQLVKKGTLIGKVGSSGDSTGPHLHYEVIKNGEHVDPIAYFTP